MNPSNTILVAVDFSSGSHAALVQAARVAACRNAALHVLHVVDADAVATLADMQGGPYETHAGMAAQGAQAALNRWVPECGVAAAWQGMVIVGDPLREILEHARMLNVALLVAGLQGAGQSTEGAGSVAARLVRKASESVLLVRPGHMPAFQKVLACVDFSHAAALVLREALFMARLCHARLECLHVWKEPWVVDFNPEASITSTYPVIIFTHQERETHMQQLREELHGHVSAAAPDIPCAETLREAVNHGACRRPRGGLDHAGKHRTWRPAAVPSRLHRGAAAEADAMLCARGAHSARRFRISVRSAKKQRMDATRCRVTPPRPRYQIPP